MVLSGLSWASESTTIEQTGVHGKQVVVANTGSAHAQDLVPEPDGYRMTDFRSSVPDTLSGATVLDTDQAYNLWLKKNTLFIDAMPQAPKPDKLPEGTVWREKPRTNIPGSYWLANLGFGEIHPDADIWLQSKLRELSNNDLSKPVLVYCLAECWMSWNLAKRILSYGYTRVYWYPDGMDGWIFEDHPTEKNLPIHYNTNSLHQN